MFVDVTNQYIIIPDVESSNPPLSVALCGCRISYLLEAYEDLWLQRTQELVSVCIDYLHAVCWANGHGLLLQ